MSYIKDKRKETMSVEDDWLVGDSTTWKSSMILHEFAQGFKDKKIIGGLCTGCGKIIVPTRHICGRCHRRITEKAAVSDIGTITTYIVSAPFKKGGRKFFGMDPVEVGLVKEGEVVISAYVKLDGSDSNFDTEITGVKPEDVYVGMRVKAVWAENREGKLSDLASFEPFEAKKGGKLK